MNKHETVQTEIRTEKAVRPLPAVLAFAAIVLFALAASPLRAAGNRESSSEGNGAMSTADSMEPEGTGFMTDTSEGAGTAVFAGGCFWGVEAVFEQLEGVENVVSGYSGGAAETAQYNTVGTGATGHAESVRIDYDPERISYEKLLEIFFTVAHDPTQLGYQGPDVGSEYRSVVFYADEAQKRAVERMIGKIDADHIYKDPVVTEVVPLKAFYPAEDYHQNFIANNPNYPYVVYWDLPKLEHLEQAYPDLVKKRD